jgi:hypothetical protein
VNFFELTTLFPNFFPQTNLVDVPLVSNSPFAGIDEIQLARLSYEIEAATGAISIDPSTGLEYRETTTGMIQAYIKTMSKDTRDTSELARNPYSTKVMGYCVYPMLMPSGLGAGTVFDYSFTESSRSPARTITGTLHVTGFNPHSISVVSEELGDRFYGYLILNGGGRDGA